VALMTCRVLVRVQQVLAVLHELLDALRGALELQPRKAPRNLERWAARRGPGGKS
jgi:hypothetical protein